MTCAMVSLRRGRGSATEPVPDTGVYKPAYMFSALRRRSFSFVLNDDDSSEQVC